MKQWDGVAVPQPSLPLLVKSMRLTSSETADVATRAAMAATMGEVMRAINLEVSGAVGVELVE